MMKVKDTALNSNLSCNGMSSFMRNVVEVRMKIGIVKDRIVVWEDKRII